MREREVQWLLNKVSPLEAVTAPASLLETQAFLLSLDKTPTCKQCWKNKEPRMATQMTAAAHTPHTYSLLRTHTRRHKHTRQLELSQPESMKTENQINSNYFPSLLPYKEKEPAC